MNYIMMNVIMECLDDCDESIRLRALDLISGMVRYHIAGYLHGLQLLQMPLMYHELVIFTIVLFATLNLMNGVKL